MADHEEKTHQERIQSVLTILDGPTSLNDIADKANVPTDDAKHILDRISGEGGIANRYGDKYDLDLAELEKRKTSPPSQCYKCGTNIELDDQIYEIHWERYNGEELSGNGWLEYCEECAPPGMRPGDQ